MKHDAPYDLEFSVARAEDGAHRAVHSIAVVDRDKQGRPLKVIGVLQDVTDRRRLQEEYGKALSTTLDGFWLCDNRARVTLVNDAICAMLGYTREEMVGMPISELEVQPDLEAVKQRRMRVRASARIVRNPAEAQGRNRCSTPNLPQLQPQRGGHLACMRDITERKRRENNIRS